MLHKNLNFVIEKVGKDKILFLHGWGGNGKSLDVLKNIPNKTIMSLDFFYPKEKYESTFDTYESALQVYLTLKEHNIDKVSIVSHSYGGRVAILLSSVFDIKINKLFLISSAGVNYIDLVTYIKVVNYKLIKLLVKLKIYNKNILLKYGSSDYKSLSDNYKQIFKNIIRQDLKYLLNNVSADNTILIYGRNDSVTPIKVMKRLCNNIKNNMSYVIDNAEHFVYITHREIITDIIYKNL